MMHQVAHAFSSPGLPLTTLATGLGIISIDKPNRQMNLPRLNPRTPRRRYPVDHRSARGHSYRRHIGGSRCRSRTITRDRLWLLERLALNLYIKQSFKLFQRAIVDIKI